MAEKEKVLFSRGPSATIPSSKVPGTIYITTDTGEMFVDDTATSRVQVGPSPKDVRSLGIPSASVGQFVKIKAVDDSGVPTEWEAVDIPQSDWEQSDATASDYIKNRPFYEGVVETLLDPTFENWAKNGSQNCSWRVDGVDYINVVPSTYTDGGAVLKYVLGDVTVTVRTGGLSIQIAPSDADVHLLKRESSVKQLDPKFLPDNRFIVAVTQDGNSNYTADKTIAEITAAYAAGKDVAASFSGMELPLRTISNGNVAIFDLSLLTGDFFQSLAISNTGVYLSEELPILKIYPDDKTSDMTSPVGMDADGRLWSKADTSLNMTGATVGQIAKITAVDDSGKPADWEAVDMPSGEVTATAIETALGYKPVNAFYVTVTPASSADWTTGTADKTDAEIYAAYEAGGPVLCRVASEGRFYGYPAILPIFAAVKNGDNYMFAFCGSGVPRTGDAAAIAVTVTRGQHNWHVFYDALAKETDIPTELKNPNALTFTGAASGSYDGSSAMTVNIPSSSPVTAASIEDALGYKPANPTNVADRDHTHPADKITAGTFSGKVVANQTAVAVLGDAQVRNIKITDTDLVAGTSELASGEVVIVYE